MPTCRLPLCTMCGRTDPTKFKRGCKSTCSKCYDIIRRRRLGVSERIIKVHCCKTCGETSPDKFVTRCKSVCLVCKGKIYYSNNRDKILNTTAQYKKSKSKSDPSFKLIKNLRDRQGAVLKGRCSTTKNLGCDSEFLRQYIQSMWEPWMDWNNYGIKEGYWSVDHILPLSSFDRNEDGEWDIHSDYNKKLIHYTNLRPMLHIDNVKKRDRII